MTKRLRIWQRVVVGVVFVVVVIRYHIREDRMNWVIIITFTIKCTV